MLINFKFLVNDYAIGFINGITVLTILLCILENMHLLANKAGLSYNTNQMIGNVGVIVLTISTSFLTWCYYAKYAK